MEDFYDPHGLGVNFDLGLTPVADRMRQAKEAELEAQAQPGYWLGQLDSMDALKNNNYAMSTVRDYARDRGQAEDEFEDDDDLIDWFMSDRYYFQTNTIGIGREIAAASGDDTAEQKRTRGLANAIYDSLPSFFEEGGRSAWDMAADVGKYNLLDPVNLFGIGAGRVGAAAFRKAVTSGATAQQAKWAGIRASASREAKLQGAIGVGFGAAGSYAGQTRDIEAGLQDEFSPMAMGGAAAASGALIGGIGGLVGGFGAALMTPKHVALQQDLRFKGLEMQNDYKEISGDFTPRQQELLQGTHELPMGDRLNTEKDFSFGERIGGRERFESVSTPGEKLPFGGTGRARELLLNQADDTLTTRRARIEAEAEASPVSLRPDDDMGLETPQIKVDIERLTAMQRETEAALNAMPRAERADSEAAQELQARAEVIQGLQGLEARMNEHRKNTERLAANNDPASQVSAGQYARLYRDTIQVYKDLIAGSATGAELKEDMATAMRRASLNLRDALGKMNTAEDAAEDAVSSGAGTGPSAGPRETPGAEAKVEAETAKTKAETAKTEAETAKTEAETAAGAAAAPPPLPPLPPKPPTIIIERPDLDVQTAADNSVRNIHTKGQFKSDEEGFFNFVAYVNENAKGTVPKGAPEGTKPKLFANEVRALRKEFIAAGKPARAIEEPAAPPPRAVEPAPAEPPPVAPVNDDIKILERAAAALPEGSPGRLEVEAKIAVLTGQTPLDAMGNFEAKLAPKAQDKWAKFKERFGESGSNEWSKATDGGMGFRDFVTQKLAAGELTPSSSLGHFTQGDVTKLGSQFEAQVKARMKADIDAIDAGKKSNTSTDGADRLAEEAVNVLSELHADKFLRDPEFFAAAIHHIGNGRIALPEADAAAKRYLARNRAASETQGMATNFKEALDEALTGKPVPEARDMAAEIRAAISGATPAVRDMEWKTTQAKVRSRSKKLKDLKTDRARPEAEIRLRAEGARATALAEALGKDLDADVLDIINASVKREADAVEKRRVSGELSAAEKVRRKAVAAAAKEEMDTVQARRDTLATLEFTGAQLRDHIAAAKTRVTERQADVTRLDVTSASAIKRGLANTSLSAARTLLRNKEQLLKKRMAYDAQQKGKPEAATTEAPANVVVDDDILAAVAQRANLERAEAGSNTLEEQARLDGYVDLPPSVDETGINAALKKALLSDTTRGEKEMLLGMQIRRDAVEYPDPDEGQGMFLIYTANDGTQAFKRLYRSEDEYGHTLPWGEVASVEMGKLSPGTRHLAEDIRLIHMPEKTPTTAANTMRLMGKALGEAEGHVWDARPVFADAHVKKIVQDIISNSTKDQLETPRTPADKRRARAVQGRPGQVRSAGAAVEATAPFAPGTKAPPGMVPGETARIASTTMASVEAAWRNVKLNTKNIWEKRAQLATGKSKLADRGTFDVQPAGKYAPGGAVAPRRPQDFFDIQAGMPNAKITAGNQVFVLDVGDIRLVEGIEGVTSDTPQYLYFTTKTNAMRYGHLLGGARAEMDKSKGVKTPAQLLSKAIALAKNYAAQTNEWEAKYQLVHGQAESYKAIVSKDKAVSAEAFKGDRRGAIMRGQQARREAASEGMEDAPRFGLGAALTDDQAQVKAAGDSPIIMAWLTDADDVANVAYNSRKVAEEDALMKLQAVQSKQIAQEIEANALRFDEFIENPKLQFDIATTALSKVRSKIEGLGRIYRAPQTPEGNRAALRKQADELAETGKGLVEDYNATAAVYNKEKARFSDTDAVGAAEPLPDIRFVTEGMSAEEAIGHESMRVTPDTKYYRIDPDSLERVGIEDRLTAERAFEAYQRTVSKDGNTGGPKQAGDMATLFGRLNSIRYGAGDSDLSPVPGARVVSLPMENTIGGNIPKGHTEAVALVRPEENGAFVIDGDGNVVSADGAAADAQRYGIRTVRGLSTGQRLASRSYDSVLAGMDRRDEEFFAYGYSPRGLDFKAVPKDQFTLLSQGKVYTGQESIRFKPIPMASFLPMKLHVSPKERELLSRVSVKHLDSEPLPNDVVVEGGMLMGLIHKLDHTYLAPKDSAAFADDIADLIQVYKIQARMAPGGVMLPTADKKVARDALQAVLDDHLAEQGTAGKDLLDLLNADADATKALLARMQNAHNMSPIIANSGGAVSSYNMRTGVIDLAAPGEGTASAFNLGHEMAHWLYNHVLSPEERISYLIDLRDRLYTKGGGLKRGVTKNFGIPRGDHKLQNAGEIFADDVMSFGIKNGRLGVTTDMWSRIKTLFSDLLNWALRKKTVTPEMEYLFDKVLPVFDSKSTGVRPRSGVWQAPRQAQFTIDRWQRVGFYRGELAGMTADPEVNPADLMLEIRAKVLYHLAPPSNAKSVGGKTPHGAHRAFEPVRPLAVEINTMHRRLTELLVENEMGGQELTGPLPEGLSAADLHPETGHLTVITPSQMSKADLAEMDKIRDTDLPVLLDKIQDAMSLFYHDFEGNTDLGYPGGGLMRDDPKARGFLISDVDATLLHDSNPDWKWRAGKAQARNWMRAENAERTLDEVQAFFASRNIGEKATDPQGDTKAARGEGGTVKSPTEANIKGAEANLHARRKLAEQTTKGSRQTVTQSRKAVTPDVLKSMDELVDAYRNAKPKGKDNAAGAIIRERNSAVHRSALHVKGGTNNVRDKLVTAINKSFTMMTNRAPTPELRALLQRTLDAADDDIITFTDADGTIISGPRVNMEASLFRVLAIRGDYNVPQVRNAPTVKLHTKVTSSEVKRAIDMELRDRGQEDLTGEDAFIPAGTPVTARNIIRYFVGRTPGDTMTQRTLVYRLFNLIGKPVKDAISDVDLMTLPQISSIARSYGAPHVPHTAGLYLPAAMVGPLRTQVRKAALALNGKAPARFLPHELTHLVVASLGDKESMARIAPHYRKLVAEGDELAVSIKKRYGHLQDHDRAEEWLAERVTEHMLGKVARGDVLGYMMGRTDDLVLRGWFDRKMTQIMDGMAYAYHGLIGSDSLANDLNRLFWYGNIFKGDQRTSFDAALFDETTNAAVAPKTPNGRPPGFDRYQTDAGKVDTAHWDAGRDAPRRWYREEDGTLVSSAPGENLDEVMVPENLQLFDARGSVRVDDPAMAVSDVATMVYDAPGISEAEQLALLSRLSHLSVELGSTGGHVSGEQIYKRLARAFEFSGEENGHANTFDAFLAGSAYFDGVAKRRDFVHDEVLMFNDVGLPAYGALAPVVPGAPGPAVGPASIMHALSSDPRAPRDTVTLSALAEDEKTSGQTTIASALNRIFGGKPKENDFDTIQRAGSFDAGFAMQDQVAIKNGFHWIAGYLKDATVNEHVNFAKLYMPIRELLDVLPDSRTGLKRWKDKTTPLFTGGRRTGAIPASHQRIMSALRHGKGSPQMRRLDGGERAAYLKIREAFDDTWKRLDAAGLQVGKIEDFYPQVWEPEVLARDKDGFISLMTEYFMKPDPERRGGRPMGSEEAADAANDVFLSITSEPGGDVYVPGARASRRQNEQTSTHLEYRRNIRLDKHPALLRRAEKYMAPDLETTLVKYFDTTERRLHSAEWFGLGNHAFDDYFLLYSGGRKQRESLRKLLTTNISYRKKNEGEEAYVVEGLKAPFDPARDADMVETVINRLYDSAGRNGGTISPKILERQLIELNADQPSQHWDKRARAMANAMQDSMQGRRQVHRDAFKQTQTAFKLLTRQPMGHPEVATRWSKRLRAFNGMTLLSYTMLSSMADPVLSIVNSRNMASSSRAIGKYISDPDYRDGFRRTGVAIENELHSRMAGLYGADVDGNLGRMQMGFFNASLLTPWTDFNRGLAASIGFEAMKTEIARGMRVREPGTPTLKQPRAYRNAHRFLKRYDMQHHLEQGLPVSLDDKVVKLAMVKFANDAIFTPDANRIPGWAQTPWGAIFFQLKAFPLEMSRYAKRNVYDALKTGDYKTPLMFMSLLPLAGAGVSRVKDLALGRGGDSKDPQRKTRDHHIQDFAAAFGFDDKDRTTKSDFAGEYLNGFLTAGGYGLWADLMIHAAKSADNGIFGTYRTTTTILGPSASMIGTAYAAGAAGLNAAGGAFGGETDEAARREGVRGIANRVPFAGGQKPLREWVVDMVAGPPAERKKSSARGSLFDNQLGG